MSYEQIGWQNKPSTATPINATNLNHMDAGIAANDSAIGTLQADVANKVDKVEGKGLSTNDFTDADALKLAGIEDGAEVNVQADWDEADNTADDYIKNKPNLGVYAEKDRLWTDATASGNPVTIKTQSAQAAKQTILTMLPIQSGSGTPSPDNVRPISGRTQAKIVGCGKNLVKFPDTDTTIQGVTYLSDNNAMSIKRTDAGTIDSSPWSASIVEHYNTMHWGPFPAGTYSVIVKGLIGTTINDRVVFYARYEDDSILVTDQRISGEPGQIANGSGRKCTFTATKPFKCCTWIRVPAASTIDCVARVQMERGTEITEIEPYVQGIDVTISFGSTIYGGTLDVETGVLSVEWAYIASYNGETITEPWISDRDEYVPNTTPSTGAEVAYKLASPTTTTLTAAQVALIKGINNVSTDADSLTITYFNDGESLTDADNRITGVLGDFAKVEGARASQNYAIGDYLIFSDKFCKASAAIASGEALAIGTNLTQTTVGAELKAILAQL